MRFAWIACLLAGCGGAAIPPPATANDPSYPSGPYGYAPGGLRQPPDVIPDLLFAGKVVPVGVDAASVPAQMISLGSLRTSGLRFFVIETAGEWCSDCVGDQAAMMQLEHDYASKGVLGIELLLEAAIDISPTLDNLDRWSNAYGASGTLVLDANKAFEHAAGIIAFPSYFIIDTATMKIVTASYEPLVATPLGPILDAYLAH
jgi:hypothetical protein